MSEYDPEARDNIDDLIFDMMLLDTAEMPQFHLGASAKRIMANVAAGYLSAPSISITAQFTRAADGDIDAVGQIEDLRGTREMFSSVGTPGNEYSKIEYALDVEHCATFNDIANGRNVLYVRYVEIP